MCLQLSCLVARASCAPRANTALTAQNSSRASPWEPQLLWQLGKIYCARHADHDGARYPAEDDDQDAWAKARFCDRDAALVRLLFLPQPNDPPLAIRALTATPDEISVLTGTPPWFVEYAERSALRGSHQAWVPIRVGGDGGTPLVIDGSRPSLSPLGSSSQSAASTVRQLEVHVPAPVRATACAPAGVTLALFAIGHPEDAKCTQRPLLNRSGGMGCVDVTAPAQASLASDARGDRLSFVVSAEFAGDAAGTIEVRAESLDPDLAYSRRHDPL